MRLSARSDEFMFAPLAISLVSHALEWPRVFIQVMARRKPGEGQIMPGRHKKVRQRMRKDQMSSTVFYVTEHWMIDASAITQAKFYPKGKATGPTELGIEPEIREQHGLVLSFRDGSTEPFQGDIAERTWNRLKLLSEPRSFGEKEDESEPRSESLG